MRYTTRAQWGARPPESVALKPVEALRGVTVHWFGSPSAASTHGGCSALLRSVQRSHQAGEFNDIAYNWGVCPHGEIYQLRGFGVKTGANGTSYSNENYAAVVYMAGTGDRLTQAGKRGLSSVIREYHRRGAGRDVKPHGYWTGSACPGPDVRAWIAANGWKVTTDTKDVLKRRATLRAWITTRRKRGWSWERLKATANWREWKRLGGK